MADPIEHKPRPAKVGPDAHEELERLLQTAHEHGVLRFANDLIAAKSGWSEVIVNGLNGQGARNAVQNLAVLAMALTRIEPKDMYKLTFALKDAAEHMERSAGDDADPPGVTGAYRMLHDDALWRAITPLLESLKVFADSLNRDVDKPISDFTGKRTEY